ncbi:MAG: 3' terminal RNA ribose 2'-O-methyltransferase Hen1 [Hyphomicrobiaceae bacterium]|nr:3' terminal RNA ribose 2'-O-methyltransferase Hen1 [Hyphomicrobiaceae bacterium]
MLLTVSTTYRPATDLGFLLHKNPAAVHAMALPFGKAQMFYPEATEERCTFALALDIDPVALVRGKRPDQAGLLDQYVNDRPYAASSFLSVAMAKCLRNALGGSSKERQALADTPIPLTARVLPLPIRGADGLLESLFRPLGYDMTVTPIPLDETWPEWGASPYVALDLAATCRLRDLLAHLYVLIPVLDRRKHYYVDRHEIEKLLEKGEGWLAAHPAKELITTRYLGRRRSMVAEALARLIDEAVVAEEAEAAPTAGEGETEEGEVATPRRDAAEEALEKPIRLHDVRLDRIAGVLKELKARRVVDLGCGSGKLLKRLMAERSFDEILGVEVSASALELAERRLKLDRLSEARRKRIKLIQGALTYRDRRIEGFDAAALSEVIEHLDPDRLPALERVVFEFARPRAVVITTPNREYNAKFEGMAPGKLRHADHRFEWTRAEFEDWARGVAGRHGYSVRFEGLGEVDEALGAPSQMGVFER